MECLFSPTSSCMRASSVRISKKIRLVDSYSYSLSLHSQLFPPPLPLGGGNFGNGGALEILEGKIRRGKRGERERERERERLACADRVGLDPTGIRRDRDDDEPG